MILKTSTKGAALLLALIALVLMTGFGLTALRLTQTEFQIAVNHREALAALYYAEAGINEAIAWFTFPEKAPGELSLWNDGICSGDRDAPDFSTRSTPTFPLPVFKRGKVIEITLYAPRSPNGICTVESYARSNVGGIGAVAVELAPNPMGPLNAAIAIKRKQTGNGPVLAHWGEILYQESVSLGPWVDTIPLRNPLLLPNGYAYGSTDNQDPWITIRSRRSFLSPLPQSCPACPQPYVARPNLFQKDATLELEGWDIKALRQYAKKYGTHLTGDTNGTLYQEGKPLGTFDSLFANKGNVGFVLIEPQEGPDVAMNRPTINLDQGSYHGYFFVKGDVRVRGNQSGRDVDALTPAWPPDPLNGERKGIRLSAINLNGLLNVMGEIHLEGRFFVYGTVYTYTVFGPAQHRLEVWYNDAFRSNHFEGQPHVYSLPGTWREIDTLPPLP